MKAPEDIADETFEILVLNATKVSAAEILEKAYGVDGHGGYGNTAKQSSKLGWSSKVGMKGTAATHLSEETVIFTARQDGVKVEWIAPPLAQETESSFHTTNRPGLAGGVGSFDWIRGVTMGMGILVPVLWLFLRRRGQARGPARR